MSWNDNRRAGSAGRPGPVAPELADRLINLNQADVSSLHEQEITAVELISQAAEILQSFEDQVAQTTARAQELARRTSEQMSIAEHRIRTLDAARKAAETNLSTANARAAEAEQAARLNEQQIAEMEDRLSIAEERARNAEARAIEAEKILVRIEDTIRDQLLSKRQPPLGRSIAA